MPRSVAPVVRRGSLRAIAQPALIAADLLLRPWRPDDDGDVAAVLAAFADPEIQRWGARDIRDADRARAWLRRWDTGWAAETDACWAVARDGVVIARVALRRLDMHLHSRSDPPHHPKTPQRPSVDVLYDPPRVSRTVG